MNMAVMATSPKPPPALFSLTVSFWVYFLLKKMDRTMPHMMQMLMSRAMVAKLPGVILAADRVPMPTCSAAAWATWVS